MDEARMICDRKVIRPDQERPDCNWYGCLSCGGAVWTERLMGEAYRPPGCPHRRGSGQNEDVTYHSSTVAE